MGKKKKRGGKKGGAKGKKKQPQKKKKQVKKTCSECFSELPINGFSQREWSQKSFEGKCKKCESSGGQKGSAKKSSKEKAKVKKVVEEEEEELCSFSIGDIPKQFVPKEVEKNDEDKKWDEMRSKQTPDPSIRVRELFKEGYPTGEICPLPETDYTKKLSSDNTFREEKEKNDKELKRKLYWFRECAEVHRQVRQWAQKVIVPGMKFTDVCQGIEDRVEKLMECNRLKGGFAFPIGCSTNHQAAHWTPNPGDNTTIKKDDVVKIDIGLHKSGYIIDSAFTLAWNPTYDKLLEAVREATNVGVKECGIDVRLCDIGDRIQEVMESYEVEIDGKTFPVKTIENLNGHSLERYEIHSGITVPITKGGPETKMEEGDVYAIETFGSTGKGHVFDSGECSHFMMRKHHQQNVNNLMKTLRMEKSKKLLAAIRDNYRTLCFCPRWLENKKIFGKGHRAYLRDLVKKDIVKEYPPLCDVKGSFVAQYEHSLILRPTCKEVFSRGDDF